MNNNEFSLSSIGHKKTNISGVGVKENMLSPKNSDSDARRHSIHILLPSLTRIADILCVRILSLSLLPLLPEMLAFKTCPDNDDGPMPDFPGAWGNPSAAPSLPVGKETVGITRMGPSFATFLRGGCCKWSSMLALHLSYCIGTKDQRPSCNKPVQDQVFDETFTQEMNLCPRSISTSYKFKGSIYQVCSCVRIQQVIPLFLITTNKDS